MLLFGDEAANKVIYEHAEEEEQDEESKCSDSSSKNSDNLPLRKAVSRDNAADYIQSLLLLQQRSGNILTGRSEWRKF